MRFDFHTHTLLSDGELHPLEHIRTAHVAGHAAVALTDHVGLTDAERVVLPLVRECAAAESEWKVRALPGVEITHVPPRRIAAVAKACRKLGARIVVVHGETVSEPVLRGTNAAAVACADVDVLAHPGLLSEKDARTAKLNGIFLELSGKRTHAVANGHVARVAERAGAALVLNGDVHGPDQFVSDAWAQTLVQGAGVPKPAWETVLRKNPKALLARRG